MNRDAPPKHKLGDRIRYRFDNLLARGTWAALAWLGAITLGAVLVSAVLLALFGVTLSGSQDSSFLEDFWQSLLRVMDPGTMANDTGWGRRVLALLVTVFGLLVAGTLIGIIAAGVEDRVGRMRRGRSIVFESGHLVVLGASERLPVLIQQLVLANARRAGNSIVVMADRDPADMYDEVRRVVEDRLGSRLVYRSGDPTRRSDLELVRLHDARAVIVLADEEGGDAKAIKTVVAVGAELGGFGDVPIVVELGDPATGESLIRACGTSVHPIIPAQAVARTAAFALREAGIGQVVTDLLDFKGADLHVRHQPRLTGMTFSEAVAGYAKARPIGIMHSDGRVEIKPAPDTRFVADDRLIAICDDIESLVLSDGERPRPTPAGRPELRLEARRDQERLLVIGWNQLGDHMLDDWVRWASPRSTVEILFDSRILGATEISIPDGWNARATLTPVTSLPDLEDRLTTPPPVTTVLLLGYVGRLSTDEADSRTLLDLVALRRHLGSLDRPAPRVIVQLLDADNIPLAELSSADDFIVSQALGSQMIAQLAEQPERRQVFLELYGSPSPSIHMTPVEHLGMSGDLTVGEVVSSSYGRGLLAIGWRRSASRGGELVLNPHESDVLHLEPGDAIVVIG